MSAHCPARAGRNHPGNHPERMMLAAGPRGKSEPMAQSQGAQLGTFQVSSRPLAIGGALMAAGAVIGLAGLTVSTTVMLMAAKRWIDQMETPPAELARQKWHQARAATQAGASAWQDGLATSARS
jgi:hypothetical protein